MHKIFTLGNSEFPVSWENEIKLWTFLETRTALLLKTYKTTIEVSGLKCHFCVMQIQSCEHQRVSHRFLGPCHQPLILAVGRRVNVLSWEAQARPGRPHRGPLSSKSFPGQPGGAQSLLLLKSGLGGLLQDDCSILEKQDLAPNSRVVIQLRLAEKKILEKASASGRTKRLHFEKKLEEGAALPRYPESDLALLANSDAKIPIILRKLEEMEEGQDLQLEKSSATLGGEEEEQEDLYGTDMKADGRAAQEDAHKTSRKTDVGEGSTPALVVG